MCIYQSQTPNLSLNSNPSPTGFAFCGQWASQVALVVRNRLPKQETKRLSFDPWVWKIPWNKKRQNISVFLPEKLHGQRSLMGYSLWGCKESDAYARMHTHTHTHMEVLMQQIHDLLDQHSSLMDSSLSHSNPPPHKNVLGGSAMSDPPPTLSTARLTVHTVT